MPQFNKDHIIATTHEFKSNLSRYTRLLEEEAYVAVFVTRYERIVGVYMTSGAEEAARPFLGRAKKEGRRAVRSWEDDVFRNKASWLNEG
jgi:hypothetical protein